MANESNIQHFTFEEATQILLECRHVIVDNYLLVYLGEDRDEDLIYYDAYHYDDSDRTVIHKKDNETVIRFTDSGEFLFLDHLNNQVRITGLVVANG